MIKKNGKLFSIDIDDCANVSNSNLWHFYQTRDDNFDFIKSKIPKKIDVLFIDTIHEANHVKKKFYITITITLKKEDIFSLMIFHIYLI